jgi:hypothetical protein
MAGLHFQPDIDYLKIWDFHGFAQKKRFKQILPKPLILKLL